MAGKRIIFQRFDDGIVNFRLSIDVCVGVKSKFKLRNR